MSERRLIVESWVADRLQEHNLHLLDEKKLLALILVELRELRAEKKNEDKPNG